MPNRSYPRSSAGGPIAINTTYGWQPLDASRDVPAPITPGLFNQAAYDRHVASHERLFYDKYGQHLMQVPKGQWGQPPRS